MLLLLKYGRRWLGARVNIASFVVACHRPDVRRSRAQGTSSDIEPPLRASIDRSRHWGADGLQLHSCLVLITSGILVQLLSEVPVDDRIHDFAFLFFRRPHQRRASLSTPIETANFIAEALRSMDVSKLIVIWPNNVDSTRTIKKGRRIPIASGCEHAHEGTTEAGPRERGG